MLNALPWSSQLQRGWFRGAQREKEGSGSRQKGRHARAGQGDQALQGIGIRLLVKEGRSKEGKQRGVGRLAVFIPRQSSGGSMHVPCLMQGPPFPDAGLLFDKLL